MEREVGLAHGPPIGVAHLAQNVVKFSLHVSCISYHPFIIVFAVSALQEEIILNRYGR